MSAAANGLIVRDAVLNDAETIARFNRALALETEEKSLDPATVRAGVEKAFARPDLCRYFVAERAGEVVGQLMITYEWSDWRAKVCWWIQSVYVRPDCRRHGVFRRLYEHIVAIARQDPDVCGIRLYVERENQRAMKAYERLGMRPSGHVVYEIAWS
jgi:GNAT superfamily N-acetyltransferase